MWKLLSIFALCISAVATANAAPAPCQTNQCLDSWLDSTKPPPGETNDQFEDWFYSNIGMPVLGMKDPDAEQSNPAMGRCARANNMDECLDNWLDSIPPPKGFTTQDQFEDWFYANIGLPVLGMKDPDAVQDGDPVAAPEFDPATAAAALTLLAGGLLVLRGRRRATA